MVAAEIMRVVASAVVVIVVVVVSREALAVVVSGRPGRRGDGFRVNTPRQPRHESLDAPAATRLLPNTDAGDVPSGRSKRTREPYR